MAHACNPSYSGGRDQDGGSRPAWANSSRDPISRNTFTKKKSGEAGGVAQGVAPEFKPQYHTQKFLAQYSIFQIRKLRPAIQE
jgi:hypothetical protein